MERFNKKLNEGDRVIAIDFNTGEEIFKGEVNNAYWNDTDDCYVAWIIRDDGVEGGGDTGEWIIKLIDDNWDLQDEEHDGYIVLETPRVVKNWRSEL